MLKKNILEFIKNFEKICKYFNNYYIIQIKLPIAESIESIFAY